MSYCKSMDPNPPSEATQSSSGNTGSQESTGGGYGNTNSMKNCFYPHATINGASPGYTVWCEGITSIVIRGILRGASLHQRSRSRRAVTVR